MGLVEFALLVAAVVVAAGLLVAGLATWRRRRAFGVWLVVAGVVVLALVGVGAGVALAAWDRQDVLWANGLAEGDPRFTVDLPHTREWVSGYEYAFRVGESRDELYADLTAAYPGGRVTGESWSVVADGLGFTVSPEPTYHGYLLAADVLSVSTAGPTFIPFPRAALAELGGRIEPWTATPTSLDRDAFAEYYESLGTVRTEDDAFVVPTSEGRTATVTVADGRVTVAPG